ncbi:MAG: MinD/ParA family protein [Deltaproteobacteria bacterium]|jgi:flagellar biosynthesis protein FlhG|nr:MinD/ParA family protein [Deltaproteobacteria bacterium]
MSNAPLVISVTSGKGGVGKTNISANLAYCLAENGKKVMLLDADLGLANVDVVLGLTPEYNLFHLFHEDMSLDDIIMDTPYGFKILPAASGVSEMLDLSTGQKLELLESMDAMEDQIDYLIVDTGAGINDNVVYFNLAAQERIVVLTTEPTSLTDAYASIKVMTQNHGVQHFKIVVNMAPDKKSALDVFKRLYNACDHFLAGVSLELAAFIPRDNGVRRAVINQRPFCMEEAGGPACNAMRELAQKVQTWEVPVNLDGNIKFFWKKLLFRS